MCGEDEPWGSGRLAISSITSIHMTRFAGNLNGVSECGRIGSARKSLPRTNRASQPTSPRNLLIQHRAYPIS